MSSQPSVDTEHFKAWRSYWGPLHEHVDMLEGLPARSIIYGFENVSPENDGAEEYVIPAAGACYGFLAEGDAFVRDRYVNWRLRAGFWFALPDGCTVNLLPDRPSRMVVCQRIDYVGLRAMGGPIEDMGRLRYIDTCSDTLLMGPPIKGDPCLNLLHFPPGIDQTEHTHPSLRAGIVARGAGRCETPGSDLDLANLVSTVTVEHPDGRLDAFAGEQKALHPLEVGTIFSIPVDGRHNFLTGDEQVMDVIAFHPDSDWGPTHDDHPMVNRTWVDGEKIDNRQGRHLLAEYVQGDRRFLDGKAIERSGALGSRT